MPYYLVVFTDSKIISEDFSLNDILHRTLSINTFYYKERTKYIYMNNENMFIVDNIFDLQRMI